MQLKDPNKKMNIPVYKFPENSDELLARVNFESAVVSKIKNTVTEIIAEVKENGDAALLNYCKKYDHVTFADGFALNMRNADNAIAINGARNNSSEITPDFCKAVDVAIENITKFHEKTKVQDFNYVGKYEEKLALRVLPMETAGIYVPGGVGGTTPLISSLIMNYVPAKIAGVEKIICVSPPQKNGTLNSKLVYVLKKLGAEHVYCLGGAQAIAALAYGTATVPKVDIVTGPGNAYVNEAKRMLLGEVMIDGLYGNSEIVIISDGSVCAKHIAADMLSQCEHAGGELALLITTNQQHAKEVQNEIDQMIETQPRKKEILASLNSRGAIALVEDWHHAITLANQVAPEHLELLTKNAEDLLPSIKHAGAIFVGEYASEPIGDYIAGTNHVLPTSGAARFSSPLGVYTFQRRQNVIHYNRAAFNAYAPHAIQLAQSENLLAHKNALQVRQ